MSGKPPKLKYAQVPKFREALRQEQGGTCAICSLPVSPDQSVLDHCHSQGHIRGVLHRGCNSLLGKLENNYKRYGIPDLRMFLAGVSSYLTKTARIPQDQRVLHPTFKTDDEKRQIRNQKARERRAAQKKAQDPGL